mmetsp:Transcript_24895/g.61703  ORF Transcript_24895/g.61703 Transcript_24895/m.61703 type:complete len:154 (-) Transcript_24895:1075-1536(-)
MFKLVNAFPQPHQNLARWDASCLSANEPTPQDMGFNVGSELRGNVQSRWQSTNTCAAQIDAEEGAGILRLPAKEASIGPGFLLQRRTRWAAQRIVHSSDRHARASCELQLRAGATTERRAQVTLPFEPARLFSVDEKVVVFLMIILRKQTVDI